MFNLLLDDQVVLVVDLAVPDGHQAVEPPLDDHLLPLELGVGCAEVQLVPLAVQLDGVVVPHHPRLLDAEDRFQVRRTRGPVGVHAAFRLDGEPFVEPLQEDLPQALIRLIYGFDVVDAQPDDKAVLQGPEHAFDAAFGGRAPGQNLIDAELLEGPLDLGQGLLLAVGGRFPRRQVDCEVAGPVRVEGQGEAVALAVGLQDGHVGLGRVRFEEPPEDYAGGVVDADDEPEFGYVLAQPMVDGRVNLEQFAEAAPPFPGAPVDHLGLPALPEPVAHEELPEPLLADFYLVILPEVLGHLEGRHVSVLRFGEPDDLFDRLFLHGVVWLATFGWYGDPVPAEVAVIVDQALEMAQGELDHLGTNHLSNYSSDALHNGAQEELPTALGSLDGGFGALR